MSTRTNILLTFGKSRLWIYRHCDGYPAETGADLVNALNTAIYDPTSAGRDVADRFLKVLMAQRYDDGRQVFELTTGPHGDIEWLYSFIFNTAYSHVAKHLHDKTPYPDAVRVAVQKRAWDDSAKVPPAKEHGSVLALAGLVNRERAGTLRRMLQRRPDAPQGWRDACAPVAFGPPTVKTPGQETTK